MDAKDRRRLTCQARAGNLGAAMELAAAGKPDIAEALLRRLAAAGAEGMWHILGTMHEALGNDDRAIDAYREALAAEPHSSAADADLARVLRRAADRETDAT